MEIALMINDIAIESFEIDLSKIKTIAEREKRIYDYAMYLHRMFYRDIMLSFDWEIILIAKSKMK